MAKKIAKKSSVAGGENKLRRPKTLQFDFTGVEGKRGRRVPEGDYLLTYTDYGHGGDEAPGWMRFNWDITKGPTTGEYSEIFGMKKTQLWRLRALFEASGLKVKSGINDLPLRKLIGKQIAVTIGDDTYEGKTKSQIQDFFKAEEYEALAAGQTDDEEDEDEEEEDEDADLTEDTDEDDDELETIEDDDDDEDEDEDDDDL
jgi:hypothetical protein